MEQNKKELFKELKGLVIEDVLFEDMATDDDSNVLLAMSNSRVYRIVGTYHEDYTGKSTDEYPTKLNIQKL